MKITRVTPIDWLTALDTLSVGAFYLLNVLYRKDIHVSDDVLRSVTGYGVSTHRLQKKELIDKNYLALVQVGRAEYEYSVSDGGKDNG